MSNSPEIDDSLREAIIQRPDVILDDKDVMHALIAANERTMGENIVDLRGIAMERLEYRLDRLEDTHRSVIAAAYENLAGTNQVHRAVLRMLEPRDFETFLRDLNGDIARILRVDAVRLVLESAQTEADPVIERLSDVLSVAPVGFVNEYMSGDRELVRSKVILRYVQNGGTPMFGTVDEPITSEACMALHLGEGRLPGMLVLGSSENHIFSPQQGTDLLTFFAKALERLMCRWLA